MSKIELWYHLLDSYPSMSHNSVEKDVFKSFAAYFRNKGCNFFLLGGLWECSPYLGLFILDGCLSDPETLKSENHSLLLRSNYQSYMRKQIWEIILFVTYFYPCFHADALQTYCFLNPQNYTKSLKTAGVSVPWKQRHKGVYRK